MKNTFDINHASKDDMNLLADGIEGYIDLLEEIIVIPKELIEKHGKAINAGIKEARDLIKKLRKGKRSIFKDEEDWNPL